MLKCVFEAKRVLRAGDCSVIISSSLWADVLLPAAGHLLSALSFISQQQTMTGHQWLFQSATACSVLAWIEKIHMKKLRLHDTVLSGCPGDVVTPCYLRL
jgi:hypothetical protein